MQKSGVTPAFLRGSFVLSVSVLLCGYWLWLGFTLTLAFSFRLGKGLVSVIASYIGKGYDYIL